MAPTIKLYGFPLTCSIAAHALLEDSSLEYEFVNTHLKDAAIRAEYIKTVNPKGQVPALSIDGAIITEAPAVLYAISQLTPEKQYSGPDLVRFMEWMNFNSGSVHAKSLGPIFRQSTFTDDPSAEPSIRAKGIDNASTALRIIEDKLDNSGYALGEHFTGVDLYITWVAFWARRFEFWDESLVKIAALVKNVEAMPAYQKVLSIHQSQR